MSSGARAGQAVRSKTGEAVTTMTTEQHAWTSAHEGTRADGPWPTLPPVCGCGQDLDICSGTHCPRCGVRFSRHAA